MIREREFSETLERGTTLNRVEYSKIVNIQGQDMYLSLYSPHREDKELDISFHALINGDNSSKNFDELVGFTSPVKAFREIISHIKKMVKVALNDYDWTLTITVDDPKRTSLYDRLTKRLGFTMVGIGSDEYILVK